MRRFLLPILTWPVLVRPSCLPAADHRALLARCYETVRATQEHSTLLDQLPVLAVPLVAAAVVASLVYRPPGSGRPDEGRLYAVVGVCAVVGAAVVWASYLSAARRMRPHLRAALREMGRCQRCGYDLRGTAARCPECGTPASWPDWS